jgi:hypothetical protein
MSLNSTEQPVCQTHQLFNQLFNTLPSITFDATWLDEDAEPTRVVASPLITEPVTAINDTNGQRMILIPTHRFGVIVLYDMWGFRGGTSPINAAHPMGFDHIDSPFTGLAKTEQEVADNYRNLAVVVIGPALTPIFDRLLNEVSNKTGSLVIFS